MKKWMAILLSLVMVFAMSAGALAETGETDVKFKTAAAQISVTLPVGGIIGTVDPADGSITFPAATSTTITNNSAVAIMVSSIECAAETGWTMAATGGSVDDTIVATISADGGTTTVPLLTTAQTISSTDWNMAASGSTGDALELTLAGAIENQGAATAALTTTEAKAFTITFTVEAGAHS